MTDTKEQKDESKALKSLRECIAPLAAGAAQTAMLAYSWAHANLNDRVGRCQRVMDAAQTAIDLCNELLREEIARAEREKETAPKPEAKQ